MINLSSNDTFNIVVVGSWNPAIFSPEWAKNYLADDKNKEVVLAIPMQMASPSRLTVDEEVNFYPSTQALMIDCVVYKLDLLEVCSLKLKLIASLLQHTPVTAVGINFRFAFEVTEIPALLNLFSFDDAVKLNADKYKLMSSSLKRTFELSDSTMLNLSIESKSDIFLCEFNFHSDIKQLSEIVDKTSSDRMKTCHAQAVEFMRDVYSIDLEEF